MAVPRMKGTMVRIVRMLTQTGFGARMLWNQTAKDFRLAEIQNLPADNRPDHAVEPRPIQAAAPRQWEHAGLDTADCKRTTASDLREAYFGGDVKPSQVLDKLAKRIADKDFGETTHSPLRTLDLERAAKAAAESDQRYAEGKPLGPLDGVPLCIKDQFDMVGLPTYEGTVYKDALKETDSFLAQRLRQGGALIFAKSHCTEFGLDPVGFSQHHDMPRSAYSKGHCAGGSSTGSGAAVGIGLGPVAAGSDGLCSIRIPSCFNGVFGLMPTFHRIGAGGDPWGSGTYGTTGPIGASTACLVDFLEATGTEADPTDPLSTYGSRPEGETSEWRNALGRGVKGCRIGVLKSEFAQAEPAIAKAAQEALAALEKDGAQLVDIEIPLAGFAVGVGAMLIATETMGDNIDEVADHGQLMGEDYRILMNVLQQVSARDYFIAMRTRTRLRQQCAEALSKVDLLSLPTCGSPNPTYSLEEGRIPIQDLGATAMATRFNALANNTGLPASTIPMGLNEGLPMGLQFVADAWDEASLFAVMAHAERAGISAIELPSSYRPLL